MANKYAVFVGCNYQNTRNELHGCVNDVTRMRRTIVRRFGFPEANITFMVDTDPACTSPTGKNIRQALTTMVEKAKPGDVLFFHYSGHGTFIPAKNKSRRRKGDRYVECIVPSDFNLVTDEDFREIVNKVPEGASFTIMSDSCNSGGLIYQEKEQIGPHVAGKKRRRSQAAVRSKFIPVESLVETLRDKTGVPELEVDHIRIALFHLFGRDASFSVKRHLLSRLDNDAENYDGDLQRLMKKIGKNKDASASLVLDVESSAMAGKKRGANSDMGILLSGCQADETSADANPSGRESAAYGAFSNAVEQVLATHRKPIGNRELVLRTRKLLEGGGYSQHPCLYCSDSNAEVAFLCQQ